MDVSEQLIESYIKKNISFNGVIPTPASGSDEKPSNRPAGCNQYANYAKERSLS